MQQRQSKDSSREKYIQVRTDDYRKQKEETRGRICNGSVYGKDMRRRTEEKENIAKEIDQ